MTWRRFSHQEIADALQAYGLKAESSVALAQGTFVEAYRVRANGTDWVARVRSPEAQSEDVSFAAAWGKAVKSEVPVPEPLTPVGEVPSLGHRVVDVAPYIDHGGGDGDAGPEAWIQIGRWVGQMHRLAMPLVDVAPRNLDYGNHPNNQLFGRYLAQAQCSVPAKHREVLDRIERLVKKITQHTGPYLDGLMIGVVHGDIHFWNVLYTDKQPVAIIDLDFLQRGFLIHDLAYAYIWLEAWEKRLGGVWKGVGPRYVKAYEAGRDQALVEEERICLPYFRVLIHLHFSISKLRLSWNRLKEAEEDLVEAEEVEQALGL